MIRLREVTLQRGAKRLLERASLTVFAGQKVGIIGANGCGKTSLFALLRGALHCEAGDVDIRPGLAIAHMAQEAEATSDAALDYVLDADRELRALEAAIAEREQGAQHEVDPARAAEELAAVHERLAQIGGYSARARAAQILQGLGFSQRDLARPVGEFSGGWRVRLNLSRTLMTRSDVLLLDEPTNHLDVDAILWLEDWLSRYRGTLLLISHDREFLDNTVRHICYFHDRALSLYAGNYTQFERQRAAQCNAQQSGYDQQQREIGRLRLFIDRFRAKASKARQAQSRLKALERLERVSALQRVAPVRLSFPSPTHAPQVLVSLDAVDVGYLGTPVLHGVHLTLMPGARIGLLGANGAGKSTLIRTLAGQLQPLAGERRAGKGLKIGYFAQYQLEQLRAEDSPLQHLMRVDRRAREQDLRDYLGRFNFRAEMADAPLIGLSGGERSRLTLALIAWQRPNVLLLDEPTNHLDLDTREALTLALQEYEGAVVLVSHDRHLLRATADRFLIVADGRLDWFSGDLEDYRSWLAARREKGRTEERANSAAEGGRERGRSRVSARRSLERRVQALEAEMVQLSADKARLESELGDPNLYAPEQRPKLQTCLLQQRHVNERLAALEQLWLELQLQLEAFEVE